MFYFRDRELEILERFHNTNSHKACAIYGRRRTGKTELILHYIRTQRSDHYVYYQCTGFDYGSCLKDFISVLHSEFPGDTILDALSSFKDVFSYIEKISERHLLIVIDEFPFICKKNEETAVEFQWIIDHALGNNKLVLLGSNLSFMKRQINDREAPLYGRFDDIIEVNAFSFSEINTLFPEFEEAVQVYAETSGVAQYVMFYLEYPSAREARDALYFNKNGRLFQEAHNMLLQELRDVTTYVSILRTLSSSDKDSGQIASKSDIDPRGVFSYLNKLIELDIIEAVNNPLSHKKNDKRYRIKDNLFRFNYTFIEPNVSMINALGADARPFILNERYDEYLGTVYEDIIRSQCYQYAAEHRLPFMPTTVGKWWGNIKDESGWHESEVDVIAFDDRNILIGECKYRNKRIGMSEYELLKAKSSFISTKNRRVYYLLASRSGFTDEVLDNRDDIILIDKA